jgi:DNA helicase-2/ATP-dependent DNA helicase PcrA
MLSEGADNFSDLSAEHLFDELFTNHSWLVNGIKNHAPDSFTINEINRIHRWCTRQHYARVDKENHRKEHACYDVEDDTILLRLYQITRGSLLDKNRRPLAYNHLVVDEVQDLSPVELMLLLKTTGTNKPITLAGDTAQQISENTDFQDWKQVLTLLGHEHIEVSPLQISYRATEEVMQLAHDILGHLAPEQLPVAKKSGAPVSFFNFNQAGQCLAFLTDVLRELGDIEPNANVGILTHSINQAEEIYRGLMRADLPRLHLVRDYDFSFSPGIEITTVKQVKGLEFDYVLVADCNANTYPNNDISRRLLHVAVTRTAYQCWLLSVGRPSPLIPDYLLKEQNDTK